MGRYLINLLQAFAQVAPRHRYIVYGPPGMHRPAFLDKPCFEVKLLPCRAPFANRTIYEQWSLPRQAHADALDVLFMPAYTAPILPTACALVTAIHDAVYLRGDVQIRLGDVLVPWLFSQVAARRSTVVLTDSEAARNEVLCRYKLPAQKVRCIYNASDAIFRTLAPGPWDWAVRRRYGLNGRLVLYVGQILRRRHVPALIQSFGAIARDLADCHLLLVGANRLHPAVDLRALVRRLGLGQQVSWVEYVSESDLLCLYNLADVFVYVSSVEGFGLPVLEAMACGCPVITSNTSSLAEVAGDAACQVTPGDVAELEHAMRDILNNRSLRETMARNGVARAAQFSWRSTAERTLQVFDQVARRPAQMNTGI
jgi:glycosyltransferase involved in cell wall biosynthesis